MDASAGTPKLDGHFLEPAQFQQLRSVSTARAIEGIVRAWLPVLAVALVLGSLKGTWAYFAALPVAWLIVASRQHAVAGLVHEAAHRILFRNRFANDWVGRWLLAFPLCVSLARYRAIHLEHHRKLGTDEDPDLPIYTRYPVTKAALGRIFLKDLWAKSVLRNLAYFIEVPEFLLPEKRATLRIPGYVSDMGAFWAFQAVVVLLAAVSGHLADYILIWVIPYATLLQVLLRLRGALEHGATASRVDVLRNTRTVTDNPLVLSVLAPLGLNFHLEHHLYPTVPWYRLKKVHELLHLSKISGSAHCVVGYDAGIKELIRS